MKFVNSRGFAFKNDTTCTETRNSALEGLTFDGTAINLRLSAQRSVKVISRIFLNQESLPSAAPAPVTVHDSLPSRALSLHGGTPPSLRQPPVCHRTDQRAGTMRADRARSICALDETETARRKVDRSEITGVCGLATRKKQTRQTRQDVVVYTCPLFLHIYPALVTPANFIANLKRKKSISLLCVGHAQRGKEGSRLFRTSASNLKHFF